MATIIAMIAPMKIVPQNSGRAPYESPVEAPTEAIGSGDQWVPNRNLSGETSSKNR